MKLEPCSHVGEEKEFKSLTSLEGSNNKSPTGTKVDDIHRSFTSAEPTWRTSWPKILVSSPFYSGK
jgi:hypothetical protein